MNAENPIAAKRDAKFMSALDNQLNRALTKQYKNNTKQADLKKVENVPRVYKQRNKSAVNSNKKPFDVTKTKYYQKKTKLEDWIQELETTKETLLENNAETGFGIDHQAIYKSMANSPSHDPINFIESSLK